MRPTHGHAPVAKAKVPVWASIALTPTARNQTTPGRGPPIGERRTGDLGRRREALFQLGAVPVDARARHQCSAR